MCGVLLIVGCVLWSGFVKIKSTIRQNRTNIDPQSVEIWSRVSWGPFWVSGRAKDGPGHLVQSLCRLYERICNPKDAFLEIPKIKNGTKTAHRRQDRHRYLLKRFPGMVDKNHQNHGKLSEKTNVFMV